MCCVKLEMQVRLVFDEPESGVTVIKLKQTDVPEEDMYAPVLHVIFVCASNFESVKLLIRGPCT